MEVYNALFRIGSLGRLRSDRAKERCFEALCLASARINLEYLREHPRTPAIYHAAVRYRSDTHLDPDPWCDLPLTLAARGGDCDDLVPWRLAELWNQGYSDARPMAYIQRTRNGRVVFHILIKYRNRAGIVETEDPSALLGMPK